MHRTPSVVETLLRGDGAAIRLVQSGRFTNAALEAFVKAHGAELQHNFRKIILENVAVGLNSRIKAIVGETVSSVLAPLSQIKLSYFPLRDEKYGILDIAFESDFPAKEDIQEALLKTRAGMGESLLNVSEVAPAKVESVIKEAFLQPLALAIGARLRECLKGFTDISVIGVTYRKIAKNTLQVFSFGVERTAATVLSHYTDW